MNVENEGLFATVSETQNKNQTKVIIESQEVLQPIRVKQVMIQNYKSIDYKEYVLDGKSLFLKGKNGLGKTNVLEAIYWALSGVLFDGTGKSERMEIKPKGSEPETETSVKLVFTGGNDFVLEKKLVEKYDSKGNYKGTETSTLINGTPIGQRDGQERLIDLLGLEPMVRAFKKDPNLNAIDVLALIYNPELITAMDYKQLRALIISIIGDVSFEQTIRERIEYYEPVSNAWKINGGTLDDLKSATKNSIHDKNYGLDIEVTRAEAVLKEYDSQAKVELNMDDINNAKSMITEIDNKLRKLRDEKIGGDEAVNANYNAKINAKSLEISNLKLKLTQEHQTLINKLTDNSIENEIDEKRKSITRYRDEKSRINDSINEKNGKKVAIEQTIIGKNNELTREKNFLEAYKDQWKKLTKPENDITYTCPHCNKPFGVSETSEYKSHIIEQKSRITSDGNTTKERVKALEKGIEELNEDKEALLKDIQKLQGERTQIDSNIAQLNTDIQTLETKRNEQRSKLPVLMIEGNQDYQTLMGELNTFTTAKNEALSNLIAHKEELSRQINELENERLQYADLANKEYVRNENARKAIEKRKELEIVKNKLQAKKELTTLIKELERETYAKLDSKIANIFGNDFTFQLYKENVSNGEYDTRMCEMYVKDSHDKYVNINRINTGLYPIRWAEFISVVKKHYGVPQSFVLVDEVSSLDSEHRTRLMCFGEQVLATSVSDQNAIEEVIE